MGMGCVNAADGKHDGSQQDAVKSGPTVMFDAIVMGCNERPGPTSLNSDIHFPPLKSSGPISPNSGKFSADPILMQKSGTKKGSGFFDVSQNNFGPQVSPIVETKNSFGKLQDEEECFDTEYGLWEKDMLLVRKFMRPTHALWMKYIPLGRIK
ncbi:hypothetical protein Hanom_Chr12g01161871 [Helianthus anomalus]